MACIAVHNLKLIGGALASTVDFEVMDREHGVTIASRSFPHRSKAIEALCFRPHEHPTMVPTPTSAWSAVLPLGDRVEPCPFCARVTELRSVARHPAV